MSSSTFSDLWSQERNYDVDQAQDGQAVTFCLEFSDIVIDVSLKYYSKVLKSYVIFFILDYVKPRQVYGFTKVSG